MLKCRSSRSGSLKCKHLSPVADTRAVTVEEDKDDDAAITLTGRANLPLACFEYFSRRIANACKFCTFHILQGRGQKNVNIESS